MQIIINLFIFLLFLCSSHFEAYAENLSALNNDNSNLCRIPSIEDNNFPYQNNTYSSGASLNSQALLTVPQLSSKPGALITLIIDFDGHPAHSWFFDPNIGAYTIGVPVTPPYNFVAKQNSACQDVTCAMTEIWKRVSEIYAPFDVNVTTIDPGTYPLASKIKIIVGGSSWAGPGTGGVSVVNSFLSPYDRWGFCFPDNLGSGNPKYTADCIAHEAGHTFGLIHQSSYSGTTLQEQYNSNNNSTLLAPIMGLPYLASRSLWWYGQSEDGSNIYQNDVNKLLTMINFDYADDDVGNTTQTSAPLTNQNGTLSAKGTIESLSDTDVFSFTADSGNATFEIQPAYPGGTVDLKAILKNSSGTTLLTSVSSGSTSAGFSTVLSGGTYYLFISSEANLIGDLGSYTISGNVSSGNSTPAPTSTSKATATSKPNTGGGIVPIPKVTASPTATPSSSLAFANPLTGTILEKKVLLIMLTKDISKIIIKNSLGKKWELKPKSSTADTINFRLRLPANGTKLNIFCYSGKKITLKKKLILKVGAVFQA